jgi:hypothetical protein
MKEVNTMCASSSGRVAEVFPASGTALSEKVANGKINVQLAWVLNMVYKS